MYGGTGNTLKTIGPVCGGVGNTLKIGGKGSMEGRAIH